MQTYRDRARQLRADAERSSFPHLREDMLRMAEHYEQLAAELERAPWQRRDGRVKRAAG